MAKTSNITACVEPDVKEKAEEIMAELGIPVSVVINMLYKQIILTKSIPFSISIPTPIKSLDEMSKEEFDAVMKAGYEDAVSGKSSPADNVFSELRRGLNL